MAHLNDGSGTLRPPTEVLTRGFDQTHRAAIRVDRVSGRRPAESTADHRPKPVVDKTVLASWAFLRYLQFFQG